MSIKKNAFLLTLCIVALVSIAQCDCFATTYYVATTGVDSYSPAQAQSRATPWATIAHASSMVKPGDTVDVLPGTYAAGYIGIAAKGAPAQQITFVGENPKPFLTSSSGTTVDISRSSYVVFKNFDVTNTDHVPNAKDGGNGLTMDGGSNHISIENCTVHDCGGGGINTGNSGGAGCDYITIKHNLVYNNAWYAWYQCSGISLWMNENADPTDPGIHNYIVGNICHDNGELRVTDPAVHTDGNGIIIDVGYSHCPAQGGVASANAQSYVGYNTCYNNGGCGVHVYLNDGVTFDHNTCYHNCSDPHFTGGGELSIIEASNCKLIGNIAVSSGSTLDQCVSLYQADNAMISGNLYFNGKIDGVLGTNTVADPVFKAPSTTPPNFDVLKSGPGNPKTGLIGAWSTYASR